VSTGEDYSCYRQINEVEEVEDIHHIELLDEVDKLRTGQVVDGSSRTDVETLEDSIGIAGIDCSNLKELGMADTCLQNLCSMSSLQPFAEL